MSFLKKIKYLMPRSTKKIVLRCRYILRARKFRGSKYFCSICSQSFDSFISLETICDGKFIIDVDINGNLHTADSYETLNIDNFLCPICGAQDKARLYALFLKQKLGQMEQGKKIKLVHFAPEGGLDKFLKWDNRINYCSADLYRDDVDIKADLTSMKVFEDESIDAFICSHMLEHIHDDKVAVNELFRILKMGGWGIIMVPILLSIDTTFEDKTLVTDEERLKHFGQEDHVRIYSKRDFVTLLTNAGFSVKQLGEKHFTKNTFGKLGLSKTSVLYIVEKL